MGFWFSKFLQLFGEKEARILVLGLDNAGKTTILCESLPSAPHSRLSRHRLPLTVSVPLHPPPLPSVACVLRPEPRPNADRLQVGEVVSTIPTIGFNVETVQYKNIKFQVWDLGGQTSIRPYWRCYYPNTQAIIYVVDSTDVDRLETTKNEFHAILEEDELKEALVLVFANKQDLPGSLDAPKIAEALELHKIKSRTWTIFKTSAMKGEGLFEGLDWLAENLKNR